VAELNTYWGTGTPSALIVDDNFSARFTRVVSAGTYTVSVKADDGYRIKLDGVTLADRWDLAATPFALATNSVTVPVSNATAELSIEYQELSGVAVLDVDITGIPFLKTNTGIGSLSGMNALGSWTFDTFAAPGNSPASGNPANSMNLGLVGPRAIAADGNTVYIADAWGKLFSLDRSGTVYTQHTLPTDVVALEKFPLTFLGLATQCDVGSVGAITGLTTMKGTSCGNGVMPGTYSAASMVFEGTIQDMAVDGEDVYILDNKYVWKTTATFSSFKAVIGTSSAGTVPDGTTGLSYPLSSPLSLAARNGELVIGEATRVLYFTPTGTDTFDGEAIISGFVSGDPFTALPASNTSAVNVSSVEFYDDNLVLFAEQFRNIVRIIDLDAETVSPVAGKEWVEGVHYNDAQNTPIPASSARLFEPTVIAVGNNAVYVGQDGSSVVRRLN
jgi:PA14 domain